MTPSPAKTRIVQIGAGGIGQLHLKLWRDVKDAEVVGVFDLSRAAAERGAAQHSGAKVKVFGSLAEALAADADAVDVCVPNVVHTPTVLAALAAGRHVLCEKPLAVTSVEIERMIEARDAAGRLLMTAQHFRFDERTTAFRRFVAGGRLGDVYYARAFWLRRRMTPATPGFLSKSQAGGGPCLDIGVHVLDLSMHLMGFPTPTSVTGIAPCRIARQPGIYNAWGAYDPEQFEVEDFAAAMVRFTNGAALSLEVSWMLNMEEDEEYGVHLHGDAGAGRWPDLTFAREQDGLLINEQVRNVNDGNGHANELRAFVTAVRKHERDGGRSPVPAEESLVVARILEGVYESARTGGEVRL